MLISVNDRPSTDFREVAGRGAPPASRESGPDSYDWYPSSQARVQRGSAMTGTGRDPARDAHVLVEFQTIGNSVKVTAIDPATLVEVSIVGPASAGDEELSRNAVNKLRYMLARRGKA